MDYQGKRTSIGAVVKILPGGKRLSPRLDAVNHSPDGFFEWGDSGSGPAQLAFAILADHTGDDKFSLKHYQVFKFEIIAGLPREGFTLRNYEIENFVKKIKAGEK